jgi:G3E family GTPase
MRIILVNLGGLMPRIPLVLLGTIDPFLRDAVTLTATLEPGTVVVRHDLIDEELIRRFVSDLDGVVEDVVVPLDHACVSCAVREDAIPTLRRLAETGRWDRALLALPVAGEALPVARTLVPHLEPNGALSGFRLASTVGAVDLATFEDDVLGDDLLVERERALTPGDRRSVGEALVGLVEHADVVVATDGTPRAAELLEHLRASDGERVRGLHNLDAGALFCGEHDPVAGEARVTIDREPDVVGRGHEGYRTVRLTSARPFHPDRLLARIEELGAGRVRSRGVFWVPTRPDSVIAWEGVGGQLSVGEVGEWADAPQRTVLTFTGLDADLANRAEVFDEVLMTADELASGLAPWLGRADVLAPWLGDRALG